MAGPWENYQTVPPAEPPGPWSKYAGAPSAYAAMMRKPEPEAADVPGGWIGRQVAAMMVGASAGLGKTVLAGQELAGAGLKAVGAERVGNWMEQDAREGVRRLEGEEAPYAKAAPTAALVGEIGGSSVLPGGIVGKVGLAARPILGGVAMGTLSGALTPTEGDDFWTQKVLQTGLGFAAGGATGVVANRLAAVLKPNFSRNVRTLVDEGVGLTPGQLVGGATRRFENVLASLPVVGSYMRTAENKGIEEFNRAAINHALEPIGGALPASASSGHAAIKYAENTLGRAYDRLLPRMVARLDRDYVADITGVMTLGRNLPQPQQGQLDSIIQREILDRFTAGGGVASGQTANEIQSELGRLAKDFGRSENYDIRRLGRAVKELQASTRRMELRVNPTLAPELMKIRQGYANFKIVQDAAGRVGAKEGVFTPAQLLGAVRSADFTKDKAAFARGGALLQGLADAAKDVLPAKVNDSGTPERLIAMSALGGGTALAPHIVLPVVAGTLPYTSVGMSILRKYAASQPGAVRNTLAALMQRGGPYLAPGAVQGALQAGQP
jgi:hypothetical protein